MNCVLITTENIVSNVCQCTNSVYDNTIAWLDVDVLIYHKSLEEGQIQNKESTDVINKSNKNEKNVLTKTRKIFEAVKRCIYINDINDIQPLLYGLVKETGGYTYVIKDYIYDDSVLSYLIENYGNVGTEFDISDEDLQSWQDIIKGVLSGDISTLQKIQENTTVLEVLEEKTDVITKLYQISQKSNKEMLALLHKTDSELKELTTKLKEDTIEIEALSSKLTNISTKLSPTLKSTDIYIPSELPIIDKKMLYIKCVGDVMYLNSFLYYYASYSRTILKKKATVLLIKPDNYLYSLNYSHLKRVSPQTAQMMVQQVIVDINKDNNMNKAPIMWYTQEPTNKVFEELLKLPNDVLIVIDMTQSKEILIKEHVNLKILYAFQSIGTYRRLFLSPQKAWLSKMSAEAIMKKSIFSAECPKDCFLSIPRINDFVSQEEKLRTRAYAGMAQATKAYNILTDYIYK